MSLQKPQEYKTFMDKDWAAGSSWVNNNNNQDGWMGQNGWIVKETDTQSNRYTDE